MPQINAASWFDENMQRLYPLADDATCMSASGVLLPPSFISDLQLVLPAMDDLTADSKFYISSITRTLDAFKIEISYQADAYTSIACAVTEDISLDISNTDTIEHRTVRILPTLTESPEYPQLTSISGKLIVGTCFDMQNIGILTFDYEATKIISIRVYFYQGTFESITFENENESYIMRNNFTIRAGDGIEFVLDDSGDEPVINIQQVSTSAAENDETAQAFLSVSEILRQLKQSLGNPIRFINGVSPAGDGNINIEGGDCLNVKTSGNTISVANPCGSPCCSESSEADKVEEKLKLLEDAQNRLTEFYTSVNDNILNLQSRLLSILNT